MKRELSRALLGSANSLLGIVNLKLIKEHDWDDPATYIPFKTTLSDARKAGLSVSDYIDATYNVPGATERTIQEMSKFGVFQERLERICEIGPGSGRYLEKVQQIASPAYYEIYETATVWGEWLAKNYHVTLQPTDGKWLTATPAHSINLIHAHKAFGVMPFLSICRYFIEMARVVKEKGVIVFDVVTEECMNDGTLGKWIDSGIQSGSYPSFVAKEFVLSFFLKRGFSLVGTFFIPMRPGQTQYFIFRKQ